MSTFALGRGLHAGWEGRDCSAGWHRHARDNCSLCDGSNRGEAEEEELRRNHGGEG